MEKTLGKVLTNELTDDANFLVIPIVGMGGVGKTTLARQVYNDTNVKSSFEVRAWVCVSDGDFDVTRISKAILKDIGFSSSQDDLNGVQKDLEQKVQGKKFLLVLDDIWRINQIDWEKLEAPFRAGAVGSRIIVTTRINEVAETITPRELIYPLRALSDEDCWSVFYTYVIDKNEAISAHPDYELIRKKVIEMSQGLPLAAKTLGGLLHLKEIDDWLKTLNNKLWDLFEDDQNGIPAALKLSYLHLPSDQRRCFAYCAIFPKDYEFEEEEIVFLWMTEGLVQLSTRNKQMEDLERARGYLYDLQSRSLFQASSRNNGRKFVMHDLVHDMAEWAFGERILRLDGALAANEQLRVSEKVRHFSYTSEFWGDEEKFEVIQKAEDLKARIRTFLPIFPHSVHTHSYITNSVPFDLLPKLKRLRVLSLESYNITKLPISVGGLKHIRYLNLSYTRITSLPESTSLLYNLQILMLRNCYCLKELPSSFKYLIKLHHFDIKGAILIKAMPLGMEKLTRLQKLSNFIVCKGVGSNLKDLMCLRMLRGEFCISGLDNVIEYDPRDSILGDKEDLKEFLLEWGSQFIESRRADREEDVLGMLRPHKNLEKLTITCFGGTKFPSWVGDASYSKITVLNLKSCEKCTSLPSLVALVALKNLKIEGMKGLTRIGPDIQPLQSLENLCFEDLPEWVDWEPMEENEYGGGFPCLRELSLVNCPKLSARLPQRLPLLKKLDIRYCRQLVVTFTSVPMLCELEITGCKRITCNNPVDFKSLKSLTLSDISEFSNQLMQECFGKAELQQIQNIGSEQLDETCIEKPPEGGLQSITFLTELCISSCSSLVSFPEVCSLPNLSKLKISFCNALTSLPEGMKNKNACLESLEFTCCGSLACIVKGELPLSLKRLEISMCDQLESLWDDREEESCSSTQGKDKDNSTYSSRLEYLSVSGCPSLTSLSSISQLPPTLKHLEFRGCSQLRKLTQSGQLPASLEYLYFSCPRLTTIAERFQNNASLEDISITGCENLETIPEGLSNISRLKSLKMQKCPNIVCFPEDGLPSTNLHWLEIQNFDMLKALPNGLRSLTSLTSLTISKCPNITSFNPEEDFPTNLVYLTLEDCVNVYRPLVEWGLDNLTSLRTLAIYGCCSDVESFPQQEMKLPPSLAGLTIRSFPKLKNLCSQGLEKLNSLDFLMIWDCPELTSLADRGLPNTLESLHIITCPKLTCFPEQGLPPSLRILDITRCPKLEERIKNKGRKWSKISHIFHVVINYKALEEDEQPQSISSNWHPINCCSKLKT